VSAADRHAPGSPPEPKHWMGRCQAPLLLFTDNEHAGRAASRISIWRGTVVNPRRGGSGPVHSVGAQRTVRVTSFMHWLDYGMPFAYPNIKGIEAGWGRLLLRHVSVKRSFVERVGGLRNARLPYLYDDLRLRDRADKHGLRFLL